MTIIRIIQRLYLLLDGDCSGLAMLDHHQSVALGPLCRNLQSSVAGSLKATTYLPKLQSFLPLSQPSTEIRIVNSDQLVAPVKNMKLVLLGGDSLRTENNVRLCNKQNLTRCCIEYPHHSSPHISLRARTTGDDAYRRVSFFFLAT